MKTSTHYQNFQTFGSLISHLSLKNSPVLENIRRVQWKTIVEIGGGTSSDKDKGKVLVWYKGTVLETEISSIEQIYLMVKNVKNQSPRQIWEFL